MKKLLLSLGALSAVVAPVAAVVACGTKTETPAKSKDAMHPTLQSTKSVADLKAFIVKPGDTPSTLKTGLGINQTPMAANGAIYTWDADALTLTTTSTASGVTLTQVITVTPAKSIWEVNGDKEVAVIAASDKSVEAVNAAIAAFIADTGYGKTPKGQPNPTVITIAKTGTVIKNKHAETQNIFTEGSEILATAQVVYTDSLQTELTSWDSPEKFGARTYASDGEWSTQLNRVVKAAYDAVTA